MEYSDDNLEAFSGSGTVDNREPCGNCGRKFNPDALSRHMPICAKNKPRKVFNAAKQRAEGTDIVIPKKKQQAKPVPAKKSNWRAQHEDFINTIRSAKQVSICQEKGLPLPPPPPPSINPDYIQCDYCDRRFNQKAAERHIPFCKEQHSRLPRNKPDANAKKKREQQIGYRAPRIRGSATAPNSLSVGGGSYGSRSAGSMKSPTSPGNSAAGSRRPANSRTGIKPSASSHNGSSRYDMDSPDSGRPLRTGRTQETYSEARELSAKQRSTMTTKKSPASRYGGGSPSSYGRYQGNPESGYNSNASEDSYGTPMGRIGSAARFCHDCGTKYPIATAKFCCECGVRRMNVY